MVEVSLEDVAVSGEDGARFLVLLKAPDGELLPIVIDALQALSIVAGRQGEKPERPLTHDLVLSMLGLFDATVERVEITELRGGTYFGVIVLERQGVQFEVDARPSDALSLAVRADCPIWVAEEVLEAASLSDDLGGGRGGAVEA